MACYGCTRAAGWLGFWLGISFVCGLQACLQQTVLRIFLMIRYGIPWNISAFCDECADCGVPRRVGGSWMFVHRLLLEHLASQYETEHENG